MPLAAGSKLSFYEVLAPLGAGAMGEVYRAKDTRLDREVAIKVLPEHFASDEERLRRFEREAKTLASLNHANVAQIFGVDQIGDTCFLVLELVPGESLEERLARGPLPLEEALEVCEQIAAGLEAAHEAGVIHRDLKPANVRLTPEGKVKVLDFGLAKPARESQAGSSTDSVLSTESGRLLGTPTYMAPEQARGKAIDRRVDIWAFGCVLFECLTGKRAFAGETLTDVLGAVLHTTPDLARLPRDTPPRVRELVADCLVKDARLRARDIGEIRRQLERALTEPAPAKPKRQMSTASSIALALFAAVASSVVGVFVTRLVQKKPGPAAPAAPTRFVVTLPEVVRNSNDRVRWIAVRPDGRQVAVAIRGERRGIFVRDLSSLEVRLLPGTEGAREVCFSPDGKWLAYFDDDRAALRRVALEGGSPQTIALMSDPTGISWSEAGAIAAAPEWGGGLFAVDSTRGTLESLTTPDPQAGERGHTEPFYLPGGRALLYGIWNAEDWDRAEIGVLDLQSRERHVVQRGGSSPRYLPLGAREGALLYVRAAALWARRFDPAALECRGDEVLLVEGLQTNPSGGTAQVSLSEGGTLAYQSHVEGQDQSELVWADREGKLEPACPEKAQYETISLSADGKRLVFARGGALFHLYSLDLGLPLEERRPQRLTFEGDAFNSLLSPDGARVAYSSNVNGSYSLYVQDFVQGAQPRRIFEGNSAPRSWSHDGTWIAFVAFAAGKSAAPDIWIVPADGSQPARPFLQSPADEHEPCFSPDGNLLAFTCDEGGHEQVWVVDFPAGQRRVQVSSEGGWTPRWSLDGREIFFRHNEEYFAVSVTREPALAFGRPRPMFRGSFDSDSTAVGLFQAPDGRFLMNRPILPAEREMRVVVIEHFDSEVRSKLGLAPAR